MNQPKECKISEILIEEYSASHEEEVVSLLCGLQSYLVEIDPEKIQLLSEDYQSNYLPYVLKLSYTNHGVALIAKNDGIVIGFAASMIEQKDEEDRLTNRRPIRGIISELIVAPEWRGKGVGKRLIGVLEERFKEVNCEYSVVDVFGPNGAAQNFNSGLGYGNRNIEMMKKLY